MTPLQTPAGTGARLKAHTIDTLILIPAASALLAPLVKRRLRSLRQGDDQTFPELTPAQQSRLGLELSAAFVTLAAAYEIPQLIRNGRTLGGRIAGIRVIRASDGGNPTLRNAAVRWLVRDASSLPSAWLGLGVVAASSLLVAKGGNRRALHDFAAGTLVVKAPGKQLSLAAAQSRKP